MALEICVPTSETKPLDCGVYFNCMAVRAWGCQLKALRSQHSAVVPIGIVSRGWLSKEGKTMDVPFANKLLNDSH